MTDLEMARLCAEAIGLIVQDQSERAIFVSVKKKDHRLLWKRYDPLHDDAQAMALVKKFKIECTRKHGEWNTLVGPSESVTGDETGSNTDLNRAICECVARL